MKYLFISLILFCGCEENYETIPLWIDSACEDDMVANIYEAEEKLNEFTEGLIGQPKISIQGFKDFDHSIWRMKKTQTIICYYEEPEWDKEYWQGALAAAIPEKEIKLFIYRLNEETKEQTKKFLPLHEIVHYAWVREHTRYDPDSIMCNKDCNMSLEYNESDEELFCSVYDCKG